MQSKQTNERLEIGELNFFAFSALFAVNLIYARMEI